MEDAPTATTYPSERQWIDPVDELPPRPRRRLLTPLTGALLAVVLTACGFVAGVLVEKGQTGTGGTAGAAAGLRRGGFGLGAAASTGSAAGAGSAAAAGARANATIGQVANVQGRTLYVTTTSGDTVAVKVPAGETLTRATTASVAAVHPGDTVIVQGATGPDGSVTASSVRATAANASTGGFGGLGGLGGGRPAGGSGASGGGGINSLFGGG